MMRRGWAWGGVLAVLALGMTLVLGHAPEASSRAVLAVKASGAREAPDGLSSPAPSDVSPAEPAARIQGTVRDAQGPVAGARVLLSVTEAGESLSTRPCPDDSQRTLLACSRPARLVAELVAQRTGEAPVLARTTTAADGSFSLEAPRSGLAYLWVEGAQGVASRRDVRAGDTVDLVLEPGVEISGLVQDDTETPVAGALVTAVYQTHSRFFEAVTDATGHYALGPLPRGPYVVLATHERLLSRPLEVLGFLSTLPLDLRLARPRRLSGGVVLGGAPVAGARVSTFDALDDTDHHVLTDAHGHFSLEGLRPRSQYTLRATHAGHRATLSVDFDEGTDGQRASWPLERAGLTLALEPAVALRGTVRDDAGRPFADAQVTVSPRGADERERSVQTDAQGRYAVEDLGPGTFRVGVRAEGLRSPEPRELEVHTGTGQADFEFPPTTRVEGVLVDAEDQPIADAPLTLSTSDSSESFAATSGEDGRFVFALAHPGRYQLRRSRLQREGYRIQEWSLGDVNAPAAGLRVRAERLPGVRGVVVDALGLPLPGVDVALLEMPERDETQLSSHARTDAEGRFALVASTPGRYRLSAVLLLGGVTQATSREVDVGTSETQVSLRLEAGHALSGIVVDAEGDPVEYLQVGVLPSGHPFESYCGGGPPLRTATDAKGRFHFERVSGESLHLVARGRGEPPEDSEDLGPYYHGRLALTPGVTEVRLVVDSD